MSAGARERMAAAEAERALVAARALIDGPRHPTPEPGDPIAPHESPEQYFTRTAEAPDDL